MATTKSKSPGKKKKKKTSPPSGPEVWDQWVKTLGKRKTKRPFKQLSQRSALLWALPANTKLATIELIRLVERFVADKKGDDELTETLESWLSLAATRQTDESFALECLAWCHCLPALAEVLPAGPWTALYDYLVGIASEQLVSANVPPVVAQILWGELPLTLEFMIPSCHDLRKPGKRIVADGIANFTDADGSPDAQFLSIARTWLAIWTRIGWLGKHKKDFALNRTAREGFSCFVQQALRLSRNTGDQGLHQSGDLATAWDAELFRAALLLIDDRESDAAATSLFPELITNKYPPHSLHNVDSIELSANSEWAQLTVMRNGWARKSQQFLQTSAKGCLRGELNSGFATVFSGELNPQISLDGEVLAPPKHWIELCWHNDDDVDYIELEGHFGGHCRVQRSVLLAKEDGFFLIADTVLLDTEAEIGYEFSLPIDEALRFEPDEAGNEGWLVGNRKLALVLPLGLPEWRSIPINGGLQLRDDKLVYAKTQLTSQALYAPLFFDLNSKRFKKPYTWRHLTIAEQLEILPPDAAAGFRIHVGDDQFLLYRSLKSGGNRTFMGQNLNTEFFLCRFNEDGDTDELLEIE